MKKSNTKLNAEKLLTKFLFFILILLTLFLVVSCSGKSGKVEKVLMMAFNADNLSVTEVKVSGDTVIVYYEATTAMSYDDQIVAEWGDIFGTVSLLDYDNIRIVNTLDGVPYASVETTKINVDKLANSEINESVFWNDVEIKAID